MVAYEAELATFFRDRLCNPATGVIRVPTSLRHLVHMHVLPPSWEADYRVWAGLDTAGEAGSSDPAVGGAGGGASGSTSPGTAAGAIRAARPPPPVRGSGAALWWPVRPDAITFDEMMSQQAAVRVVAAAVRGPGLSAHLTFVVVLHIPAPAPHSQAREDAEADKRAKMRAAALARMAASPGASP